MQSGGCELPVDTTRHREETVRGEDKGTLDNPQKRLHSSQEETVSEGWPCKCIQEVQGAGVGEVIGETEGDRAV